MFHVTLPCFYAGYWLSVPHCITVVSRMLMQACSVSIPAGIVAASMATEDALISCDEPLHYPCSVGLPRLVTLFVT